MRSHTRASTRSLSWPLQIEEPFGILPLEAITDTIAKNIDELCAQIDKAEVRTQASRS